MKNSKRVASLVFFAMASCSIVAAQGKQASIQAFNLWKEKAISNVGSIASVSFRGVGVAVEPSSDSTARLNVYITVGSSRDVNEIPALTIVVQPVSIIANEMVDVGGSSKIRSSRIERSKGDEDEIVYTPRIVIPITDQANGIRITIQGFENTPEKSYIIILPIRSGITTGALGKVM